MARRRKFNPSISNSANVKTSQIGTIKANDVAVKDLNFCLPLTIPHLNE